MSLDAIARTLWRLAVTHRRLLQWQPAALAVHEVSSKLSERYVWRQMLSAPLTALGVALCVAYANPAALWVAAPLLGAWLWSPNLAIWTMRPHERASQAQPLSTRQRRTLRKVAHRTWQFFEHFVGPESHWLPPDNYHEAPEIFVSHRTSPTNIGLLLLATVAAYDLGYLGITNLLPRLRYTFESLKRLERYRGHFLNWYRLDDLTPLEPRYVSTVDSGNLAGSFVALRGALAEIDHGPVPLAALNAGTVDILRELRDNVGAIHAGDELQTRLGKLIDTLIESSPGASWYRLIRSIEQDDLPELQAMALTAVSEHAEQIATEELAELRRSFNVLRGQLAACLRECDALMPWTRWPDHLLAEAGEEVEKAYASMRVELSDAPSLATIAERCRQAGGAFEGLLGAARAPSCDVPALEAQIRDMQRDLDTAERNAEASRATIQRLVGETNAYLAAMDFAFLYDADRHLLRLGYTITTGEYDPNHYDLLASEARLASFVGILKGDIPPRHWLHLGRTLARVGSKRALVSWGATAFEYLMPHLLMRAPAGSLVTESCRVAVEQQRAFADGFDIPWGISESAFYQLDQRAHYQYRAFGVPKLGLRVESDYRLVVSPYASLLALPFSPQAVLSNLDRLEELNMLGRFGLFEAVDFGASEQSDPRRARIVRSYMSHHQGMIMAALDNALGDGAMVRRFHADPSVASHLYLLFEQIPRGAAAPIGWRDGNPPHRAAGAPTVLERWSVSSRTLVPQLNVLSNGHYQAMLSHFGLGASFFDGVCLTRWQLDPCDPRGSCLYIKDLDSGTLWSAGMRPVGVSNSDDYDVEFSPHMAEFHRRDHGIHVRVDVVVAPNDDVEIRRVTLTNDADKPRRLELVSYAEPVMTGLDDHERHPAFSKLFIDVTVQADGVVMARRRRRDENESPIYLAHAGYEFGGRAQGRTAYLDRRQFLGRGGGMRRPAALTTDREHSERQAASFDPAMAVGIELELPPRATTQLAFVFSAGRSRADVLRSAADYQSQARVDWVFQQARQRAERLLAEIGVEPAQVGTMLRLWSGVRALEPRLRGNGRDLAQSDDIRSMLWSRGISGDLPILMVHVRGVDDVKAAEQLVRTHTYWDRQQIAVDLVILDDEMGGYALPARSRLARLVGEARTRWRHYSQGSIFIVPTAELTRDDRRRILAAAWLMLDPSQTSTQERLQSMRHNPPELPPFVPMPSWPSSSETTPALERPRDLSFDNGLGGFSPDGREYVIFLAAGQTTPAPWSNVIANPNFGCLVTDSGASATWADNSGENRLTPWHNDPVVDPTGEALFLRDEETGAVWSPTPRPRPTSLPYEVRHGAGYTTFNHNSHGLLQSLRLFVDPADPVKIVRLRLTNCWQRARRITVTYYAQWVLGTQHVDRPPYIVTELDRGDHALYTWNAYAHEGAKRAFLATSEPVHGATTNRAEFLGLDGDPTRPAGLYRVGLSGETIPGSDPCAALQAHLDIEAGATVRVHFVLGQGRDRQHARELVRRYREGDEAAASQTRVDAHWDDLLDGLEVTTPDRSLDLMVNRWLLYQTLSCRLWGRTALYQSGGGYGFRDQLQDVMAFTASRPQLARDQILRAAAVQFHAGDVLHWWHDRPLRGVRTRCSDDLLWLPYVTAHYVETTGDASILDERVSYLDAAELAPDETERYAEYTATQYEENVYQHCLQAIERAATSGPHGLPLIGSGDWNDGLNRLGARGRGESVWLAWFLAVVYRSFAGVCERRGDSETATTYRERADALVERAETAAWDGQWYLRAFDDDGHPMGSSSSDECRIDLNAQTWSVLAEAPDELHRAQAMRAVGRELMDEGNVLRLLTPPFRHGDSDPGYIKGYPPGVRENGAQYSHAAVWAGFAYGRLGDGDSAYDVWRCVNPVSHAMSAQAAAHYRVEPYVVAADIYGDGSYVGRGGWSWYTGAAAWAHRLAVEVILGIRRRGRVWQITPCLPRDWDGYSARLRIGETMHRIRVVRVGMRQYEIYLDDVLRPDGTIRVDEAQQEVEVDPGECPVP